MTDRPRFQQAVYDEGHTDGRKAGFTSGELYGRGMQKMDDEGKPWIAGAIGFLLAEITCLAAHALGWLP